MHKSKMAGPQCRGINVKTQLGPQGQPGVVGDSRNLDFSRWHLLPKTRRQSGLVQLRTMLSRGRGQGSLACICSCPKYLIAETSENQPPRQVEEKK
ncbi:unnamed protein product [Parascedosporium putredinis]|uniref:Uncharacterized protein n=1 Tax=Parascedosporium putredinis TaxID=1442378 RepID=A0A9P1H7J9_9PEZI|nr:unnamed protein product [Parascedosporium putredinis]CAI7999913.1 unnamed protein product [Parascedosporium putredinis]